MAWYFAGSEIEAFRINGNNNFYANGSYGADTIWGPRAFTCPNTFNNAFGDFSSNLPELWFHAHITTANAGIPTATVLQFIDSGTSTSRVQFEEVGVGSTFRLGYWNGASFTYLASASALGGSHYELDIHVKIDPTVGVVSYYINGSLIDSFSGNTSAIATSFSGFELVASQFAPSFQQVIVGDGATSTVGLRLMTLVLTAAGNANNWTNGATISNLIDNDDTTNINSNTNGQVSQYTCSAVPSGNFNVLAVFVAARAQNAVGGIQNLQLGVRSNGADTWSANISGLTTSYLNFSQQWDTNPNNANAAWTQSDLSTIQIGVKAIT